jgi:peptidoglycan hydrolase CwlO-like protein
MHKEKLITSILYRLIEAIEEQDDMTVHALHELLSTDKEAQVKELEARVQELEDALSDIKDWASSISDYASDIDDKVNEVE